jgi:hypothetical protein
MQQSPLYPALPTFGMLFDVAPPVPVVTDTSTAPTSPEDQLQPKE